MALRRGRNKEVMPPGDGDIVALLGTGSRFEGKLDFEGTVQINGVFKGEIRSADTLLIGEGAEVRANIDVGTAVITGTVVGNVRARHSIEVHSPARLTGDICTPQLRIDPGVVFEGSIKMEHLDAEEAKGNGATPALPEARGE